MNIPSEHLPTRKIIGFAKYHLYFFPKQLSFCLYQRRTSLFSHKIDFHFFFSSFFFFFNIYVFIWMLQVLVVVGGI